ncbi:MAG: hypothetical protein K6E12_09690 [Saccharofermentans sp.]|nr:hypothetical protein [Saccharofermentans sp.]
MGRPYKELTPEVRKDKAKEQKKLTPTTVDEVLKILWDNYYAVLKIDSPRKWGRVSYSKIVKSSGIDDKKNIIWIKFAKEEGNESDKRYVGTVGAGSDINNHWDYENMSGMLVNHAGLVWDDSLVLVIPVRLQDGKKRDDFEKAIGNLLLGNKIPIIDYYSHDFGLFIKEKSE